jgi:UDP-N-acetylglucosamine 2-epimerase (non-hydrolysing)
VRQLVAHIVGARPNYMKIAPVFAALARRGRVEQRLIHTGQHYDPALKDVFFAELPLPRPHVELETGSGMHGEQTGRALALLENAFLDLRPDLVVVAGDVNSTLAAALAAVKLQIPVCHVESGLRSFDWTMPEEHNRRLTDHLSSLLLTHCGDANENLGAEGISADRIAFVGNTMIDTLLAALRPARAAAVWRELGLEPRTYVLVTLHRPSLVDDPDLLARTIPALEEIARTFPVVFPMHPRTRARLDNLGIECGPGIVITEPLPYSRFLSLECEAAAVITDSGGIQEETTVLGIPCFTVRENTERPVTVTNGTNSVIGLDPERLAAVPRLLRMHAGPRRVPPLWDGRSGERAADAIERVLGLSSVAASAAAS